MASAWRRRCPAQSGAGLPDPASRPRPGGRTRPALPAPRPIAPGRPSGSRQPAARRRRALHPRGLTEPPWRDRAAGGKLSSRASLAPAEDAAPVLVAMEGAGLAPTTAVEAGPAKREPRAARRRRPACPPARSTLAAPRSGPVGPAAATSAAAAFAAEAPVDRTRPAPATRLGRAVSARSPAERETRPSARSAPVRA